MGYYDRTDRSPISVSVSQGAGPGKPEINEAIVAVNDSREEKIPFSAAEIKIELVPDKHMFFFVSQ